MSESKKLYRRPKQGKIFGVAAGLAEYFELDVTLLRIILVVLVIAGAGFIIPIYLLLALLLPTNEAEAQSGISATSVQSNLSELSREFTASGVGDRAKHYLGIGLIVVGVWLFLGRLFPEAIRLGWEFFWPTALILVGVLLLAKIGGRK
ncbi:PspC domain-containing protein [Candidatus Saccharibacteria bacterium]|nr:PspC domain-containing protein [Candidatus Saccharibacteria bacterium]